MTPGVATRALLTDMNVPLGLAIGNANEVRESVEVLGGGGPADVVELTVALAREMLDAGRASGTRMSQAALVDGRAMDTWRAMIRAQGGDPDAPLPVAKETHVVTAAADGVLVRQEALPFGIAAWRLGAGRARKEDPVVHAAGIDLHAKPGDVVTRRSAAVHALGRRSGSLRARARGARGRLRAGLGRHSRAAPRVDHGPHRLTSQDQPMRSSASTTRSQKRASSMPSETCVVQPSGAGARRSATVMPRVRVPESSTSSGAVRTSSTAGSIT